MSTTVTVSVAKPNHLPVKVFVEEKAGAQWRPVASDGEHTISVGGAQTFMVYGSRRIVIEETVG